MRNRDQDYIDISLDRGNHDHSAASALNMTSYKSVYFYAFSTLEKVEIILQSGQERHIHYQALTLEALFNSGDANDKPVTVISIRGAPAEITYSLSGTFNYEFVGGHALKTDLCP